MADDHPENRGGVWVPPSPAQLQRLLSQYKFLEMIGHGGMGAVYKARQLTLDRLVAIKILPPGLGDDDGTEFAERFVNEARMMARLNHPAIVHVHDFGRTQEGQLYLVMEYVNGTDVAKMILSQGKLPPNHALAITAHVCDALKYAHEHGVIHRDIKPANVLINTEGQVKVADFGLAGANDPAHESGANESNMTLGTPDYIAPEALVVGMEADHRADLFSVGVMLYNMLTGKLPSKEFQPASRCAGCDARFDAIIARALQPDRARRYQSAQEIRGDLDKILTTPVVQENKKRAGAVPPRTGPRPSFPAPSPRVRKETPRLWLLTVILAIAIAVGLAIFLHFNPAKPDAGNDVAASSDPKSPAKTRGTLPPSAGVSTSAPSPPAELTELKAQYEKLQAERVTTPFLAGITKLNAGYLGGLDRESANEVAAGHFEIMLELAKEKKLAGEAGPVRLDTKGPVAPSPQEDESDGPLRKLRGIYRQEMAKLDAQRASDEAALRDFYLAKLKQLEADLTKANRQAEAGAVLNYRQNIFTAPSPAKPASVDHEKNGNPSNALVIEALIDGPSELRVKKDGIYWINIKNSKPGKHRNTNEATFINGQPWQPQWGDEKKKTGPDKSNIRPISPSVDVSGLELKLISVRTNRGETGIDKRDALKTKIVDGEFSVLIPDSQISSRWYKFALVPKND